MPKTVEDLSRPSIEVKIPQVRLQLKDLAFLRSLAQPDAVHCRVPEKVMDKLRFLDLVARASVPPTEARISAQKEEEKTLRAKLQKEIETSNWQSAEWTCRDLRKNAEKLNPTQQDVLTPKGEQILRTGEVIVRARKVGCV